MHVILQRIGGAPNFCLTFEDETQYALPRAPFDAADELPKGTFTLAFWFRLHSRRAPTAANVIMFMFDNRLALAAEFETPTVYFNFADSSPPAIPAPGIYVEGWHHVAISFDAPIGRLVGYFDGERTKTQSDVKLNVSAAGTFGPTGIASFSIFQHTKFEMSADSKQFKSPPFPQNLPFALKCTTPHVRWYMQSP